MANSHVLLILHLAYCSEEFSCNLWLIQVTDWEQICKHQVLNQRKERLFRECCLRLQCLPMRKGAVPLRRDSGSNECPWESLPMAIKRRSAERSPATSKAVFLLQDTESTLTNMTLIWSRHPIVILISFWVLACVLSIFVYKCHKVVFKPTAMNLLARLESIVPGIIQSFVRQFLIHLLFFILTVSLCLPAQWTIALIHIQAVIAGRSSSGW